MESAASGLVCGISLARDLLGLPPLVFPSYTAIGAMGRYVSVPNSGFQPMNCTYGLLDDLPVEPGKRRIRNKNDRYEKIAERALNHWASQMDTVREGVISP